MVKFKFSAYDRPYYFREGKFISGVITQRAYRETFGCGDNGETILRNSFNEYKIGNEWITEEDLFMNEKEVKASSKFKSIMKELGLQ